ncbi:MAG: polyprenyl synthetase family protein [Candidatus Eisenbacteria bacterium]|nr:polyprenyl synthetase family protein [Candidatus Eisenbacteria bacterium]
MTSPTTTFERYRASAARRAQRELLRLLPPASQPPRELHRAMRYAALGPGKRIRPALAWLAYDTVGGRKFGEAVALLAGDALHTLAFGALGDAGGRSEGARRETSVRVLASALGSRGMIGGQVFDMLGEGRPATAVSVRRIHALKTAALLGAAARLGAIWGGAPARQLERLGRLGETLGLAFQAGDDLLNATATAAQLGKAAGSDAARRKATLPRALGEAGARRTLGRLCANALRQARALPARRAEWEGLVAFIESRRS